MGIKYHRLRVTCCSPQMAIRQFPQTFPSIEAWPLIAACSFAHHQAGRRRGDHRTRPPQGASTCPRPAGPCRSIHHQTWAALCAVLLQHWTGLAWPVLPARLAAQPPPSYGCPPPSLCLSALHEDNQVGLQKSRCTVHVCNNTNPGNPLADLTQPHKVVLVPDCRTALAPLAFP